MKKISNFLKSNYKKIIVSVSCLILLLVAGFSFLKPKQVNADTNIDTPTVRTKEYFNDFFFDYGLSTNSTLFDNDYLSMFTNSSHTFDLGYFDNVNLSREFETLSMSFGNNFTIYDNDNLILNSKPTNDSSSNLIISKSSGVTSPYYVIYNNASSIRGCYQYSVSYDNFVMPIKHLTYDSATGEPLNNYERNVGFGMFINGFRDYFYHDRVFITGSNGNIDLNVRCDVTLPNSTLGTSNVEGNGALNGLVYETRTYTFNTSNFNDGKLGNLYSDLFYDDNGYVGNISNIFVPHVPSTNVTVYQPIIDTYQYFAFIPKIEFTFFLTFGPESNFYGYNCYHRTPYTYSNDYLDTISNCFLNREFNTFIRSSICGTDKIALELYDFGYSDGWEYGRENGYNDGYSVGWNKGFDDGFKYSSPMEVIFGTVESFLNFEIFPSFLDGVDGFKVYHLFLFGLGVTILGIILKLALGG